MAIGKKVSVLLGLDKVKVDNLQTPKSQAPYNIHPLQNKAAHFLADLLRRFLKLKPCRL